MKPLFVSLLLCLSLGTAVFGNTSNAHKKIALTFDDGPHPTYTKQILAILKEHQIKATFYMVGKQVNRFPEIAQLVQRNGHEIGNHSYHHIDYSKIKLNQILTDIYDSQMIFYEVLNIFPETFRPPYGRIKTKHKHYIKRFFDKIVLWDIDTRDWDVHTTPNQIINDVTNKLSKNSIILMHDTNRNVLNSLPKLIRMAKKQGYKFVRVSDL